MSTTARSTERVALPGTLPRCTICHRRLRSTPWKYLQIGPICASKNPTLTEQLREAYLDQRKAQNAELDKREMETLDAELRRVGAAL